MFVELTLENFKPFGSPQVIPLKPITLIFGPNSTGKSSIIQALLLLKQSITRNRYGYCEGIRLRGEGVNLGTMRNVLHKNEANRQLGISVAYESPSPRDFGRIGLSQFDDRSVFKAGGSFKLSQPDHPQSRPILTETAMSIKGGRHELDVRFMFQEDRHENPYSPEEMALLFPDEDPSKIKWVAPELSSSFRLKDEESRQSYTRFLLGVIGDTQKNRHGGPVPEFDHSAAHVTTALENLCFEREGLFAVVPRKATKKKTTDEVTAAQQDLTHRDWAHYLTDLERCLEHAFSDLSYLGPLRMSPARHYLLGSAKIESVGKEGEHAPELMFRHKTMLTHELNSWMKTFEIPYTLDIQAIGNEVSGELVTLNLNDIRTGALVGPTDVGFGIGQLLPVLVEGLLQEEATICVEQPEIHLHPRLQAHLADFFIHTAALGKDGPPLDYDAYEEAKPNQWIIETHSESLMLRLQRRIREGRLRADDVGVLYVASAGDKGSRVMQLRLDDDGEFIDEWPDGFFEESYQEVFGR